MAFKVLDDDQVVKVKMNQAPYTIRITCCDCSLTHDVRILKHNGLAEDEIEMIFSRNRRCTTIRRKKAGIAVNHR